MKLGALLMFLSVLAVSRAARAETGDAGDPHSVAAVPQAASGERERATGAQALPTPRDRVQPKARRDWYGWKSLSTDGAALLLTLGGASITGQDASNAVLGAAFGTYLLGGPITHLTQGEPGRGLQSLALRAGLPFALGGVGLLLNDQCVTGRGTCTLSRGFMLGGAIGIVSAVVFDAAVLSYEEAPIEKSGLSNVGVSIGREHAVLVAGGTF